MIVGAFIWAIYSERIKGKNYPASILVPVMLISGFLCGTLHFVFEETKTDFSIISIAALFLLGLTRISFALWDYTMKHAKTVMLSSLSYLVPMASAGTFILCGYKPESGAVALGGILIVLGCLVVNFRIIKSFFVSIFNRLYYRNKSH